MVRCQLLRARLHVLLGVLFLSRSVAPESFLELSPEAAADSGMSGVSYF
jgi:hypothetical protein